MTWTEALPSLLTVILAVIAAIPGILALRKGRIKEKADAAGSITDSARKLLEEYRLQAEEAEERYRAKIEEIEAAMVEQAEKIRCQDRKIAQQSGELALQQIELTGQEVRIKDLEEERSEIMDGVRALCTQIRNLGHEPVWEPDLD